MFPLEVEAMHTTGKGKALSEHSNKFVKALVFGYTGYFILPKRPLK